jgi:hypothetical protein
MIFSTGQREASLPRQASVARLLTTQELRPATIQRSESRMPGSAVTA